jgi:hypothetical protein
VRMRVANEGELLHRFTGVPCPAPHAKPMSRRPSRRSVRYTATGS